MSADPGGTLATCLGLSVLVHAIAVAAFPAKPEPPAGSAPDIVVRIVAGEGHSELHALAGEHPATDLEPTPARGAPLARAPQDVARSPEPPLDPYPRPDSKLDSRLDLERMPEEAPPLLATARPVDEHEAPETLARRHHAVRSPALEPTEALDRGGEAPDPGGEASALESPDASREPDFETTPIDALWSQEPFPESASEIALEMAVAPPSGLTATSTNGLTSLFRTAPISTRDEPSPPPRVDASPEEPSPERPRDRTKPIRTAVTDAPQDESTASPRKVVTMAMAIPPGGPGAKVATGVSGPIATGSPGEDERLELLDLLHREISQHRRYPALARRQQREGTATVRFELEPDGRIRQVDVIRSSGFQSLDQAALTAVKEVSPFGPASAYLQATQRFEVRVVFTLQ